MKFPILPKFHIIIVSYLTFIFPWGKNLIYFLFGLFKLDLFFYSVYLNSIYFSIQYIVWVTIILNVFSFHSHINCYQCEITEIIAIIDHDAITIYTIFQQNIKSSFYIVLIYDGNKDFTFKQHSYPFEW